MVPAKMHFHNFFFLFLYKLSYRVGILWALGVLSAKVVSGYRIPFQTARNPRTPAVYEPVPQHQRDHTIDAAST